MLIGQHLDGVADELRLELLNPPLLQRRHRLRQPLDKRARESHSSLCGPVGNMQQCGDVKVAEFVASVGSRVVSEVLKLNRLISPDQVPSERSIPQKVLRLDINLLHLDHKTTLSNR